MILVIGEDEDAILYFRTRAEISLTRKITEGPTIYQGSLGPENIAFAAVGPSALLAAIQVDALIRELSPYLVVSIGGAASLNDTLKQGDIFIADRIYQHGIDYTDDGESEYGQIPGRAAFFSSSTSLNGSAETAAYANGGRYIERGYLLSSDHSFTKKEDFEALKKRHYASTTRLSAFDHIGGGIALACSLHECSLLTIRIISYVAGNEEEALRKRITTLEAMPDLGRILTSMLLNSERM